MALSEIVRTARARAKLAFEADKQQRTRETEDLRYYAGDQWPSDVRQARLGQQANGNLPPVPARPTLTINKLREPVLGVLNQERQSDIGIELVPADDFGDLGVTPDDTEITLREGLIRRIQRDSDAASARTWAFERAVQAGRGYYMVMWRFLPGKTNDREVYLHRIFDQSFVWLDPAHTEPDGSDANWAFVGEWVPWDVYKSRYPNSKRSRDNIISAATDSQFQEWSEKMPDWVKVQGDEDDPKSKRAVFVVDYWYKTHTPRTLLTLSSGDLVWRDELEDDSLDTLEAAGVAVVDERDVDEITVDWCKLDGLNDKPLEETEWESPHIPIVKILGVELQPYDSERRVEGMVRPSRDSQFAFNAMVSKQVETVALAPIPPLQLDPQAISGYEGWYAVANTRTLPYAPYRTYDDEGRQLAPPSRLNVEPNIMAIANSIQLFNEAIKSTTSGAAPERLSVGQSVQAASAIRRLQEEQQQNTSNYLDNYSRSLRYEGKVTNSLLYPIYGKRPGRLVRMMNGEGKHEAGMVGMPPNGAQPPKDAKVYTLTEDAKFNVVIKVTRSFDSRREQEVATIADLLSANGELMTWFGDLFFANQDGPGSKQMAERAKVMLAPPIQAMLQQKEGGQADPARLQAELAQIQGRLKEAEAIMGQMQQALEGKELENKAKLEIEKMKLIAAERLAQLESERDIRLRELQNQGAIEVAHINARSKVADTALDNSMKAQQQEEQMRHDETMARHQTAAGEAHADVEHDRTMAREEAARKAEKETE